MSLLEEVEVLEQLESEMRIAAVRCHCGMNKLVLHFNKEKSKKSSVKLHGQCPAEGRHWFECLCDYFHKGLYVCMYVWLEDEAQKALSMVMW